MRLFKENNTEEKRVECAVEKNSNAFTIYDYYSLSNVRAFRVETYGQVKKHYKLL